jgi:mannosyltransferase
MTTQRDTGLIVAFTLSALLLRLWEINADLWLDEIMTVVGYMRLPPLEAATTFHAANQHLLNSVLGSISIRIFGETVWAVRLPALLFGVATVPVFFLLAKAVIKRHEAIFATLFLTLSYHHVWFSQNARGYSAMIFFTVLSTFFLIRWLNSSTTGGHRDWLWFSLCGSLGMLSLLNYAFVLVGQFLVVLVVLGNNRDWSGIRLLIVCGVLVVALTVLGYAATLAAMFSYFFNAGGKEANVQASVAFANMVASGLTRGLPGMALLFLVTGGVVAITGWISYLKRQYLIAWMLVIPAVVNIITLDYLNWGGYPRSFLYVLPFGTLILMRGAFVPGEWLVQRFRTDRRALYVLPLLLLTVSMVILPYNYRYPKLNYTGSLAYAREQAAPDDVIAVVGFLVYGYSHYYGQDLAFPENLEALRALQGPQHRVWVLYSFTRAMRRNLPDIQDYLDTEFQLERKFKGTLGDGDVYLMVSAEIGEQR